MSAAFTESGAQSNDAERIAFAGYGANQRRTVDGLGDRAIDDGVYAGFLDDRHALEDIFQYW